MLRDAQRNVECYAVTLFSMARTQASRKCKLYFYARLTYSQNSVAATTTDGNVGMI